MVRLSRANWSVPKLQDYLEGILADRVEAILQELTQPLFDDDLTVNR